MTNEHKVYFDLYFKKRITEYKKIDEYKNWPSQQAKGRYKSLDQFFCEEIQIDQNELNEIRKYFNEYKNIFNIYNNEDRNELFYDHVGLLAWYKKQMSLNNELKCGYCEITQSKLKLLVEKRGGNLTLNNRTKRSKGVMEIEKLDSKKPYTYDNCIMACPLCNNAKSNLISDKDWRAFFVEPMKKYYEQEFK
jgi:hypothetical protein